MNTPSPALSELWPGSPPVAGQDEALPSPDAPIEVTPPSGDGPVTIDGGSFRAGPFDGRWRTRAPELSVAAAALLLNAWSLSRNGFGNSYYAAAARSMTHSWKNFFYGALDPGGFITVDKPPFALWFQAASAKVFGFSSWSLLLPSAVAGALAVLLLTVTVRRVWGRTAGLVAGIAFALMPVVVAVSRSNNPDAMLMLCAVAAAYAVERSITTGRVRWLYWSAAFCGMGFLTKLLAAGLIMPGIWAAYLIAARVPWRRRLLHLVVAVGVFVAVAGVWVLGSDLVPRDSRPYIGGSTDGTALDLVLGYNGLGRITGAQAGSGGGRPGGGFSTAQAGSGFSVDEFGGSPGVTRLFNNGMGDQVMWLAPIAGVAAAAGVVAAARRRRLDARVASLVLFTGWAGVTYLLFAFAEGIFHNYYVSLLAPAVAALVGIGAALLRDAGRVGRAVAAATLLVTALLQHQLIARLDAYRWLRVAVPVAIAAVATAWLFAAARRVEAPRLIRSTITASAAVVLLAPGIWAANGTRVAQSGSFPAARPATAAGVGGFGGLGGAGGVAGGFPANGELPPGFPAGGELPPGFPAGGELPPGFTAGGGAPGGGAPGGFGGGALDASLLSWLRGQHTTETWIVAVSSSMQADAAIIGGDSVLAMGGFSGGDPAMDTNRLASLVAAGKLRFVMSGGGFGAAGGGATSVASVVMQACTAVPASTWGSAAATSSLYDCAGQADAIRAAGVTKPSR